MDTHKMVNQQHAEHQCLPRPAQTCLMCGEHLPAARFCESCGQDVSPKHMCVPRPLPHTCAPQPLQGRCVLCGEALPARQFCKTCGKDVTAIHLCKSGTAAQVPRAQSVHICPSLPLDYCSVCGALKPGLLFCERCGMAISPQHVCSLQPEIHHCSPHLTIPRRCGRCGEMMPAATYCAQCGAEITPEHTCTRA